MKLRRLYRIIFYCFLGMVLAIGQVGAAAKKAPDLESELRREANGFNGKVGIYIKDLTTNQEVNINEKELFPTASTNKVIVAMAAYKFADRIPENCRPHIPELVSDMIIYSSNDAFGELVDQLGSLTLEKTCHDLGLRNTAVHNEAAYQKTGYHSVATARDMGKVLENLLSGRYVGGKNSKTILQLMENGIYNDEIPRLLTPKTPVAHKPGALHDIICDVGIVFNPKRPYLIAVYTKTDEGNGVASDFIAHIAAITDKHFSALSPRTLPKSLQKNIP
jgi:beta-lactamase class A